MGALHDGTGHKDFLVSFHDRAQEKLQKYQDKKIQAIRAVFRMQATKTEKERS